MDVRYGFRTKQIFFLFIKLEPGLLSWLQPRKNNCAPTELDVSISATESLTQSDDIFTQNQDFFHKVVTLIS